MALTGGAGWGRGHPKTPAPVRSGTQPATCFRKPAGPSPRPCTGKTQALGLRSEAGARRALERSRVSSCTLKVPLLDKILLDFFN